MCSSDLGRLTDASFAALRDNGFLRAFVPTCLGGGEINTLEALEIIEALCLADGSTGWVQMAAGVCTGLAGACLPPEGAKELFGTSTPIIAGQGAPNGQAHVARGEDGRAGFRLSGHWSYGSGVLHSTHLHTGAIVMENGAPRQRADGSGPEIRTFIVPTARARLEGNWEVMGLRATGSVNYSLDDVFVPEEHTHAPEALRRNQGGNVY